jgi:GTP-binding protein EngB required for normal cell division
MRSHAAGGGPLVEYRRRKLELAELIRSTMTVAAERRDEERQRSGRELLARLADDRFELAVVGQFSRGKSTLMNALLGGAYLPTGTLPMTSVITSVRYGSRPRVFVHRAGGGLPIETSLADLDRFVAQSSVERETLRVESVDVEVPAELLRLGFSFVDTPGIGSAIRANTATTTRFLPHADAVIFVTSVDAALSEPELAFLAQVRRYVEKLFVVVNKADLVSVEEAQQVVEWVQRQLGSCTAVGERVFVTAATDALAATVRGDRARLAASGLPALQHALVRFLSGERSQVFLRQTASRASRLLAQQQQDLELGRAARAKYGSAQRAAGRLDAVIVPLREQTRAQTRALLEAVDARALPQLAQRSQSWPADLSSAVMTQLKGLNGPLRSPTSRNEDDQAADAPPITARSGVERLLSEWLEGRTSELRGLLIEVAGQEVEQLLAVPHALPGDVLRMLGITTATLAPDAAAWRPAELEPLDAPKVTFAALDLDRWSAATRLRSVARRRVLDRGAAAYAHDARDALAGRARAWAQTVGDRVEVELRALAASISERLRRPGSDEHVALLAQNARRLATYRDALLDWQPAPLEPEAPGPGPPAPATDLAAACTICEEIGLVAFDYLAEQQYQLATDVDRRADHAASGGFCPLHTWLYAQIAEPVGIALTYAAVAEAAVAVLRRAARTASSEHEFAAALAPLLPGRNRCPVCLALAGAEQRALSRVLAALGQHPQANELPALCLPHLAAVLAADPGSDAARELVSVLADTLERASEDMRTFALKRQSLRRALLSDEEQASYQQIVPRVAGCRELARPWRTDADDLLP